MSLRKPKVIIIQRILTHYRKPFHEALKKRLEREGIEYVLIYGSPQGSDSLKKDTITLSGNWAYQIDNKAIKLGSQSLYWQPCLKHLKGADLIIVEQASKFLINYLLFVAQLLGFKRLCFWGHGKNFQEHNVSTIGETLKKFMSRRMHWWFAYNDRSAATVKSLGYPEERITSVQNAIDTQSLVASYQQFSQEQLEQIKIACGMKGQNICIYIGGMYPEKRLDFLLEACLQIKKQVSDFEMIFIGAGSEADKIKITATKYEWIHYLGPKFDSEKVPYFKLSKLFLMPGLVGLAVLDAFALETPLVTTNVIYHSPEIDYLIDNVNGIIVPEIDNPVIYANKVAYLLQHEECRQKLVNGCRIARDKYTIEEMVERFASGIMKALAC